MASTTSEFRAYQVRFYPTSAQRSLLARHFGAARWVWNWALNQIRTAYRDPECPLRYTWVDVSRVLTQLKTDPESEKQWLSEVDSGVLNQRLRDLDTAYQRFFQKLGRYPKRKRKERSESLRFRFDERHVGKTAAWADQQLILPKLGALKLRWSYDHWPTALPKLVTVRRDAAGRYFVSFAVEGVSAEFVEAPEQSVGIDLGIKTLATLSDGTSIENPLHLRRKLRYLKKQQRRLSRKTKGSHRRWRQARKVGRLHGHIADARRDAIHKATTALVSRYQVLCMETLRPKNMLRNRCLARSLSDSAFGEFKRQLTYKANRRRRTLVGVDPFYPSSKLCSTPGCSFKHTELTLDIRSWTCPDCGTTHDRDVNAAKNLLAEGLRILSGSAVPRGSGEPMRAEGDTLRSPADLISSATASVETRTSQAPRLPMRQQPTRSESRTRRRVA